jgi:hypothetical protein
VRAPRTYNDEQQTAKKPRFGTVLGNRDVYPRSRILIFIHPGSYNNNKRGREKFVFVLPFL